MPYTDKEKINEASRASYHKHKDKRRKEERIRKKKKKKWFQNIKKDISCSKCPESHPACLDFHHPGDKGDGLANMVKNNRGYKAILDEIAKCVVLCSNCHRKHHGKPVSEI